MIINGLIKLDAKRKTVTIYLDNGSHCFDHYVNGAARFLSDEINRYLEGAPIRGKDDIHALFPRLNEIYTPEGVAKIEEVSAIIEKMAAILPLSDIYKFLAFHDSGHSRLTYDIFRHIEENKS